MNAYTIKLPTSANQAEVIQRLRSSGADVGQIADGLCVKSELPAEELRALTGGNVTPLSRADDGLPRDVRAFLDAP